MKNDYRIATADFETDPFEANLIPKPFSWGFFDGDDYKDNWSDDPEECVAALMRHLDSLTEPHRVYMHNGGKFDFFYLLKYLQGEIRVVNGRILEASYGIHQFRDSYAAIPVPLSEYRKDDIDYEKLRRGVRNQHRKEILSYQRTDCIALHELVTAYIAEFGHVLTIGSASMRQFGKFHKVKRCGKNFDEKFRKFYYGGRNQCFQTGIINRPLKIFDINSQYPHAMRTFKHPVGISHEVHLTIPKNCAFAVIEADNYGALPVRQKLGLDFTQKRGTYWATIHEINAGEETGSLRIRKVVKAYSFSETMTFDDFVDHFYSQRMKARENGDKLRTIFYKLVLNSSYGKFAQNPENYADWRITRNDEIITEEGWSVAFECMDYFLWKKPVTVPQYYNVATAASITGAARSLMLRGIRASTFPVYCDTDSLICENLDAEIDPKKLGAWKFEGEGDCVAIAGKKLYAMFKNGEPIKYASKGAKITPNDIRRVAEGDVVQWQSDRPSFNVAHDPIFISRRISRTT